MSYLLLASTSLQGTASDAQIEGPQSLWYPVTITFDGPQVKESPSTFRDYRMDVTFKHGSRSLTVPGYFAADGNAANTSASEGNKWRVKFTPDALGVWSYTVSFLEGRDIALSREPQDGDQGVLHGRKGQFTIEEADSGAPGFYSKGMLRYVGEHYLQFAESGEYFVKSGPGSPEDFLGYEDFDGTFDQGGSMNDKSLGEDGLHAYAPHVGDWKEGDPTWSNGKGKGIIGALNYLASVGCNTIYDIILTVNGDAANVWPWTDPVTYDIYDVSKLDQWDIVFSHMDALGINHDAYLSENENTTLLDGDLLGPLRILYFRELNARFAYHLGWRWCVGEEPHGIRPTEMRAILNYLTEIDVYDHPVGHHCSGKHELRYPVYDPQLGNPGFQCMFGQINEDYHEEVLKYVKSSAEAGHKWVVANDEPNEILPGQDHLARNSLWKVLMAGGEGLNIYVGYEIPDYTDVTIEDFRRLESIWNQVRNGLAIFQHPYVNKHLAEMTTQNQMISNGYCYTKPGEVYVVYSEHADALELDLTGAKGSYKLQWYDPIEDGEFQAGSVETINGGSVQSLGTPPGSQAEWALLVTRISG
ncbi:DUF5060 domain-containing protein [Bythopirellula polymerisocia]|nr:DUF5060 domain-containing protein [Bythopirellula polymerisocia]